MADYVSQIMTDYALTEPGEQCVEHVEGQLVPDRLGLLVVVVEKLRVLVRVLHHLPAVLAHIEQLAGLASPPAGDKE